MRRLKLYLDTSAISLLFQDSSPERQEVTRLFFSAVVEPCIHDVSISTVVVDEISAAPDVRQRRAMLDLVKHLGLPVISLEQQDPIVYRLVAGYFKDRVIPPAKEEDALHVVLATRFEFDMLVTWNYCHLASVERESRIAKVNLAEGFTKPLRLNNPGGVCRAMKDALSDIHPRGWHDAAMEEVWAVKEQLWKEVQHLPLEEAIRQRAARSMESTIEAGLEHLLVTTKSSP